MHKRRSSVSVNLDSVQGENTQSNYKKDKDQLVEMAAEQIASLLWKTWLFKKSLNYKKNKPI